MTWTGTRIQDLKMLKHIQGRTDSIKCENTVALICLLKPLMKTAQKVVPHGRYYHIILKLVPAPARRYLPAAELRREGGPGRAGARRLSVPVPRPRAWRGGGGARGRGSGGGGGGEAEGKLAAAAAAPSCSGGASGAYPQPPPGGDSDSPARAPPRRGAAWETRPEDRRAPGRGGPAARRSGEDRGERGRAAPRLPPAARVMPGSGGRRGRGKPRRAGPASAYEELNLKEDQFKDALRDMPEILPDVCLKHKTNIKRPISGKEHGAVCGH
ncbi:translation initiation factor IF-2-like [Falco naumanni]|uniref:translation initiation factor IF-2-like n=1 Tax=Falco naumanni TaxID=148594 RepID=UPI001ADE8915|nr:translation initiation factor IF-2-like [Falco naumanni]